VGCCGGLWGYFMAVVEMGGFRILFLFSVAFG
jgi:hypothetical protein